MVTFITIGFNNLSGKLDAKKCIHALDMILTIYSDALYLSEAKDHSRACGHFFLGWMPKDSKPPIHSNGAFHISTTVLWFVIASVTEAELGALYHNCQTSNIFQVNSVLRYGALTTQNPCTLQQWHHSGYHKQRHQMSVFTFNGNSFFLDWEQSCPKNVCTSMAPRTRKPG